VVKYLKSVNGLDPIAVGDQVFNAMLALNLSPTRESWEKNSQTIIGYVAVHKSTVSTSGALAGHPRRADSERHAWLRAESAERASVHDHAGAATGGRRRRRPGRRQQLLDLWGDDEPDMIADVSALSSQAVPHSAAAARSRRATSRRASSTSRDARADRRPGCRADRLSRSGSSS